MHCSAACRPLGEARCAASSRRRQAWAPADSSSGAWYSLPVCGVVCGRGAASVAHCVGTTDGQLARRSSESPPPSTLPQIAPIDLSIWHQAPFIVSFPHLAIHTSSPSLSTSRPKQPATWMKNMTPSSWAPDSRYVWPLAHLPLFVLNPFGVGAVHPAHLPHWPILHIGSYSLLTLFYVIHLGMHPLGHVVCLGQESFAHRQEQVLRR